MSSLKVLESGTYRYKVKQYKSTLFDNSASDVFSVTHTIFNEGE
ncbi:hypothetical protein [Mycoplasma sp. 1654_15]|nr:hypothetical protein [Mycoplasma sp. 1654_15]